MRSRVSLISETKRSFSRAKPSAVCIDCIVLAEDKREWRLPPLRDNNFFYIFFYQLLKVWHRVSSCSLLASFLISRWALSPSQWQLYSAIVCFRADPVALDSGTRLIQSNCPCSFTQDVLSNIRRCHVKLLPSRGTFCLRHQTMHQFPVSLYLKPHT